MRSVKRHRRRPTDEEILAAVVELADDFCERRQLAVRMRAFGERQLMKSIARIARRNLVLERRGPDGRSYLSLTSEGWNVYRELA
jgi:hypothetical protein